ncbi:MAG: LamG domain-containing protein [Myxococcota bacterium]|nr:LamG domain-containing protein [Myxococcota bacterium]
MKHKDTGRTGASCARWSALAISVFAGVLAGCGGAVDNRFAAETHDEYTQPLTNAVVGTPTGVVVLPGPPLVSGGGGGPAGGGASGGSSDGGMFFDGGAGDGGSTGGFGSWHFDDCSPTSNFLVDSSGFGANAQHALHGACVPGISGLGVQFRSAKDVVQVADEPQFTVGQRVGVAAWVHPTTVAGHQPIVIKRLNNKTAFSLGIHNGNVEMSVVLTTGQTIISQAPIAAGTWTHVAGMYDGTFVFLFINGQQFGQVFAAGTMQNVLAPIRIGATTQSQHFSGIIDEVFLSTEAISKDTLTALACITRPSTLAVSPATSGVVPVNTTASYSVAVTNNDVGSCQPKQYDAFFGQVDTGITADFAFPPGSFQQAPPGTTVTFLARVTGSDAADPGVHLIPFTVDSFSNAPPFGFEQLTGQLSYELAQPTGCFVKTRQELMITSTSVVDDPIRTFGSSDPSGVGFGDGGAPPSVDASAGGKPPAPALTDAVVSPSLGVWSFGHLMRELAPKAADAPAMTLQLFQHWLTDQTINGFTVSARPAMQRQLLDIWPKTAAGELDLDRSPLTLQAIVNRVDLRKLAEGSAGEGRFVFGVNGRINFEQFTVIIEYNLPAKTEQEVLDWANRWHALSSHPFPSEEYNAALEAVTRRFTDRGASPTSVNGSALAELRTNEIALSFQWELRGFVLSPATGFFDETTVKETPDLRFNNTTTFADFVNKNASAIVAEVPAANDHTVPVQLNGAPFLGGSVFNNLVEWNGPGITNPEARFHASMNTCNGCHGPETGTTFLMVTPRFPGSEARLSPFLTGTTVFDRFSRQPRTLNDLGRRRADLTKLVCPTDGGAPDAAPPAPPDAAPPPPIADGGTID